MGFTKLDERIIQSSVMAVDPWTFKVWIALLAACKEGVAYVSVDYLARVCHMAEASVQKAIDKLSGPDPQSRSKAHKGRRIRRIDGGYRVLNYHIYRERSLQDAEAERKRVYRASKKSSPGLSRTVQGRSASVSGILFPLLKEGEAGEDRFKEFWDIYPRKRNKEDALTAWRQLKKEDRQAVIDATKRYIAMLIRTKTELTKIMHPTTFLHKDRWRDFDDGGPGTFEGARQPEPGRSMRQEKSPAYWAEHCRLKATGLEGRTLMDALVEWEKEQEVKK